jgi:NADH-quinone oxidoreductase subunit F/NAD(P)H dehydrogenase (quinone)/NADP-reducing hydrogenase subunit HndC
MNKVRTQLMLCGGTGCQAYESGHLREVLQKELERQGLADEVKIIETGCNGFCAVGPVMLVQPEGIFYQKLKAKQVPHLVEEHFLKGRPVKKLFYVEPASKETIPAMDEIPFFKHQMFWAMRNKGAIDPEVIDEYIARDGYFGAAKALQEMSSHRPEMGVCQQKPQ